MKFVLFVLSFLILPAAFAEDEADLGIQNCSQIDLNFKEVKQMRSFDNEVRMYLIDKTAGRITRNGVAITYKNFCRYINGFFETDLREARLTTDFSPNVDRVRLKLFVSEDEGARLGWLTVQIKKDASTERAAISGWFR